MSESDGRKSDLAVMEANEFKQKHRLRRVLEAHDNPMEVANTLFQMWASGEITERARGIGIQHSVKTFIRECLNLLPEPDEDLNLDDGVLNPWDVTLGRIEFENQPDIKIVGLDEFLATDEIYRESWQKPGQSRHGPNTPLQLG